MTSSADLAFDLWKHVGGREASVREEASSPHRTGPEQLFVLLKYIECGQAAVLA
jgi:hypothetical protein